MPYKKDTCPSCFMVKDARAIECIKCRSVNRPARKGTGVEKRLSTRGYMMIMVNSKEVYEHRHMMEVHLNRKLDSCEIVHHINGDRLDNRIENLEITTASEHARHHIAPIAKYMSALGHKKRWNYAPNP